MLTRDFYPEFVFSFSRSGGAGGQHVNKVSTKVSLIFDINLSEMLSDEEKSLIFKRLSNRINIKGQLVLSSQEFRSQLANKRAVVKKFYREIENALRVKKKRKKTRISRAQKEKRLAKKRRRSEIKAARRKIDPN
ncbi:MAG: aminoacyl-tRNA hydrolase [Saprospiraceae bacterium]|nr:aminoacyl-tRNA hydrolase [Saprospiraceae bacterium]